jgi:hypothetical protein
MEDSALSLVPRFNCLGESQKEVIILIFTIMFQNELNII